MIADLVLEREAQDVELVQRREGLQAVERQPMLPQRVLEIGQGVNTRSQAQPGRVHQAVEHLEPVVAHPQGIRVGKRQADGSARGPVVLRDAVQLAPHVLGGGSNVRQDPRNDVVFQILVQHVSSTSAVNRGDDRASAGS